MVFVPLGVRRPTPWASFPRSFARPHFQMCASEPCWRWRYLYTAPVIGSITEFASGGDVMEEIVLATKSQWRRFATPCVTMWFICWVLLAGSLLLGSMSAGCRLSFLFGVGAVVANVGVWYTHICVGTLATFWGSSCGAVFSVCTARDSLCIRMHLIWAYSSMVEAGVSSSNTLGNFGLGGCCVTLGGGCCTWGFTF